MVAYRIYGGNLYVADPNYPGDAGRRIEYSNGRFKAYETGDTRDAIELGEARTYSNIMYFGKSAVIPWYVIAERWSEFKDKTVGATQFPAYQLVYRGAGGRWMPLREDTIFQSGFVTPSIQSSGSVAWSIYRDGAEVALDSRYGVGLQPGDNRLGFLVTDKNGRYVDFQYVNVIRR